jgi:hypothetical protein
VAAVDSPVLCDLLLFFFFGCLEWFNFRVGLRSTLAPPLQVLERSREFLNDAALKGYDETRNDLGNGRCGGDRGGGTIEV